jgi:putative CocE/NonD family hydrolase
MASGPKAVTARHWLILGPWDHAGTRKPRAELGGLSFGPSAVLDMEDLHEAWYDHVLKGGPLPAFLKDRVACFIAGRNTWIYGSELKQIEGPPLKFELDATGAVTGDVTRGGRLVPQSPAAAASVTLISDPKVLPPRDEREAANAAPWMLNQRDVYADSPSRVIWTTAPLTAETVFAGRAQLALQLAIDQPDADVGARLYEVLADGSAVALSDTQVRLRYRRGGVQPVFMTPGKPERVEFPAMQFFARAVAKGSRLRLVVGSVADVGVDRNTNTGGDPATEPLAKARIAKITVMTGPGTGSTLAIPRPDDAVLEPRPH